ncbi:hypothetical protein E2542_SST05751 [Spatholobus suberectus]|nr:hypothetical protein E2542_SST05751 [Spatholobus suberectus]
MYQCSSYYDEAHPTTNSNAWNSLAFPRSQDEGNLPLSSPSSVTKTRSLTFTLRQSHASDRLPLYRVTATEQEKLDYHHPNSPLNLLPKIVCLTFTASAMYQTMSTSQHQPSILGPAMVVAFVASLSLMLVSNNDTIKRSYPRLAAIVKSIAFLSFTLTFLAMARVFFSGNLILWKIIVGLAMAWIMLALCIRFFTS